MADCARCTKGFGGSLGSRSFRSLSRLTPSSLRSRSRFFSSRTFSRSSNTPEHRYEGHCSPISCLPRRMEQPDEAPPIEPSPLAISFRHWIERELPMVELPDDATLDALLVGNGTHIFQHLINHVVAPKHATQLRAAIQLEIDDHVEDADDVIDVEEMQQLEREAFETQCEIESLRKRIVNASRKPDMSRLGVNEGELRGALVDAVIETLDVGTETCQKYSFFLKGLKNRDAHYEGDEATKNALETLRSIVLDARTVMSAANNSKSNHPALKRNQVTADMRTAKARVGQLNVDLEQFCNTYSLDDVANAVRELATEATLNEAFEEESLQTMINSNDPVTETTEEFAKRLSNQLQDEYLALFASSERSSIEDPPSPEKRRLDFDDTNGVGLEDPETARELKLSASALDSLDRTLSELTTGSRERISRALREAKQIDITLLSPLKPLMEEAYKTQIQRLDWDVEALDKAQRVDLLDLAEPRPCVRTWTDLRVNEMENELIEKATELQNKIESDEMKKVVHQLTNRAFREQERRENIEEKAKKSLIPMLEKAEDAAKHTHSRTVPAAAAEVSMAVKVDAFIAARIKDPNNFLLERRDRSSSSRSSTLKLYGRNNVVEKSGHH